MMKIRMGKFAVIFLDKVVVLPGTTHTVTITSKNAMETLGVVQHKAVNMVVLMHKFISEYKHVEGQIGTFVKIVKLRSKVDADGVQKMTLTCYAQSRVRIENVVNFMPHVSAYVSPEGVAPFMAINDKKQRVEVGKLVNDLRNKFIGLIHRNDKKSDLTELSQTIRNTRFDFITDVIAVLLNASYDEKLELLEKVAIKDRLNYVINMVEKRVKDPDHYPAVMSAQEAEEVLKTGTTSKSANLPRLEIVSGGGRVQNDSKDLEKKLKALELPDESKEAVMKDLERMKKLRTTNSDYHTLRDYLEIVASLPWNTSTEDNISLEDAESILEADHCSMTKIKSRILEYLAVKKVEQSMRKENKEDKIKIKNPILCFVGAPGVGKTSIAQSIANSLGRKFHRIALGGISDQAHIRGHRRTYVGAMIGRIINALKVTHSNNPVILLDEVDKLHAGIHGDPAAALLEVLDPEQNHTFVDNYLNIPFDLSNCVFICTANDRSSIPPALQDRMEIIQMSGYTVNEKFEIAKKYLLPKQYLSNGVTSLLNRNGAEVTIEISDEFIRNMITKYTMEAGVRDADRKISALCRYLVLQISKLSKQGKVTIKLDTAEDLIKVFGPVKYLGQKKVDITKPGIATGMSTSSVGGSTLLIEATRIVCNKEKEKGSIQLTGNLGDVLQESAFIAISCLRSHPKAASYTADFDDYHYHIHMPAGATPKDGPSAGITMATALYSLLSNKLVRSDVVMTGELALRGQVTAIGGVKDKVLAAHRLGYKTVILPSDNRPDAENELPEEVLNTLDIHYVDWIEQVWQIAIEGFDDEEVHYLHITSKL